MNPLLVAAAKFELDPMVELLRAKGLSPRTQLVGIGALAAAKASRELARSCAGQDVVFIGTCGTFGVFREVELIQPAACVWLPACERSGLSYSVKGSAPPIQWNDRLQDAGGLPRRTVVCAPNISLSNTLPANLLAADCVENLELYSCAEDLAATASSLTVVLAVTNAIGSDAHQQWQHNFKTAAQKTAAFLIDQLFASR